MKDRIVLLMRSRENCRLLADWLSPRYEVHVPDGCLLPDTPFDLCLIDGPCLESLLNEVQALKRSAEPAFLPFLFVAMRDEVRLLTRYLSTVVDEVIVMPTEKIELAARLESLLRARRNSVELAHQNEDMFASLVESSPLGVYLGRDGHFFYINRAGADMFGYSPEQIAGTLGPLDLAAASDHGRVAEQVRRLERGFAEAAHYTFTGVRQDGTAFDCEVFERVVRYEGRRARLGILVDNSERNALIEERSRAQDAEIHALKRADELKDQFLGILSHELRTPLNAILGFGSVLADEVAGELTPMQRSYVDKMLNGADVLLSLIDDLLDMTRVQAGKFALSCRPVVLQQVATEVVERLAALAEAKRITLAVTAPPDLPVVRADAQRLAQVFTNMVGNALKFTPEGGAVTVTLRLERRTVVCEVADTGIGIAREDLDRLFQPFSQIDMSNTRATGGTGLGLAISRTIVEAHGGGIGVRSQPGEGSTFWFSVPLAVEKNA